MISSFLLHGPGGEAKNRARHSGRDITCQAAPWLNQRGSPVSQHSLLKFGYQGKYLTTLVYGNAVPFFLPLTRQLSARVGTPALQAERLMGHRT